MAKKPATKAKVEVEEVVTEEVVSPEEEVSTIVEKDPEIEITEPVFEGVRSKYVDLYHYVRTVIGDGVVEVHELGMLWGSSVNDEVTSILGAGNEIIEALPGGFTSEGDRLMLVFGKPADGSKPKHSEFYLIKIMFGGIGESITGYQADNYLNAFIEDGWEVFKTLINGPSAGSLNVIWLLVR